VAEFLADCNERCERPRPPSCEDRCSNRSDEAFAECVAAGGTEEDCRTEADALLQACLTRCNEERPLPCDERCAQIERRHIARCVEAGGTEEDCAAAAAERLARCIANCDREPQGPPTCEERCAKGAERIAEACAERGGTEEECAAAVAAFTERCGNRCGDEDAEGGGAALALNLSESICAEHSADLLASCRSLGRPAEDCDLLVLSFDSRCNLLLAEVDDWFEMAALAPPRAFLRGDSNRDSRVDIGDPVNTLNGLFLGTGNAFASDCPDRLDANDDGKVNIADSVYTLAWLFAGGSEPPSPGPALEGQDPTADLTVCFE
jgi:hypothetical protein